MDAEAEGKLRDLRCELAEICLDARLEKISALSNAASGDALATMYNSGLRHLPMTKTDQAVAERCHRMLTVEHDPVRKACAFLALNLFSFSYRIDRSFELIDVPNEIASTMVRALLGLPQFFEKDGARKQALIHLTTSMEEIHKAVRVIDESNFRRALLNGFLDGFSLTSVYGEDVSLKDIAIMRADLIRLYLEMANLARDIVPIWPEDMPNQLRIGVLSPGAQSEMAAIRGHLSGIDRDQFHITAFVPDTAMDSVSRGVADIADALIPLPTEDITEAAQMVEQESLDILICAANITNIPTFPWTLLMAQRLARLQVSMHASPLTSGFDTVDLYINGALNEGLDAQEDYVEDLLLVEGSSNHYLFVDGIPPAQEIQRHELGLPETGPILVSGANVYKIGPDLIETWVSILDALPDAHLVLYPFNPNWAAQYPQRSSFLKFVRSRFTAAGVEQSRLHILEPQPSRPPILGLLNLADLYLDSFPYSGAVSMIEPLLCGCPPVVLEGETARCRQSAALLKEIGLDVLITGSRDDYIAVVVRLIQDEALRTEMSQAVKEMAARAGLGQSDSIGHHVGDALWAAYSERLGTTL
jgi:predicted O-linked N-acetylglucosamine transferase (SPINDLY family)